MMKTKPRIATVSLAGCFGCHMSLLDIDERLVSLVDVVDFDSSPFDDLKQITGRCAVGFIEGGCASEENVRTLEEFRRNCDVLVAVGECATQGDIPSLRNTIPLRECLDEAFINGCTVYNPAHRIPNDPELPLLLDKVYPCHEVLKIDYFLPGCPPSADAIYWTILDVLDGQPLELPYELIKYD